MTVSYDKLKQELRDRRRRIVFNNDGCDARLPLSESSDPREFLNVRTTPLAGSHVDTISFCVNSGFGVCKINSRVAQIVPIRPDGGNAAVHALIEQGTDPLRVVVDFARNHAMEVFASLRMNDTHDGGTRNRWMFEANRFKNENPECLMGNYEQRDSFRKWSAVDYDHERVRVMALAMIEEICAGYDVDGIELDYFRHPVLFKNTALGRPVTDAQRDKINVLMRRVAALLESAGEKRGRPFLLAVRTPDDPDYAASIGMDLERWMCEGWIDIYIPSGYFRQRSWRDSVNLGHRHGVKVYPGLSDSRVGGGHHKDPLRASDEGYRARAANAWQAGADGIYMFNLFDPQRRIWSELGDPEALQSMDKVYFASARGCRKMPGGGYPYQPFIQIPTLNPEAPLPLLPGGRQVVRLDLAEKPSGLPADGPPALNLAIRTGFPEGPGRSRPDMAAELTVVFNGHQAAQPAQLENGRVYRLEPAWLRPGVNTVEVIHSGQAADLHLLDVMVTVDYSGRLLSDAGYLDRTRKNM